MKENQKVISAKGAPKAVGPYSQGILCQPGAKLLFVSGQLPADPASGELIEGNIAEKTERALKNIQAIVEEAGLKLTDVVRVEIFVTDLSHFKTVNEVYGRFFSSSHYPARQTVEVGALPLNAPIEISCIAVG